MRLARIALLALMMAFPVIAAAQPGGSMGGGGWSGGGGGGGGGAGMSTGNNGAGADGASPLPARTLALFVLGGIAALGVLYASSRPSSSPRPPSESHDVRVGVLHVAFDRTAREKIQRELRAIAKRADTSNAEGRAVMLHETATVLRRLVASSAYIGGVCEPRTTRRDARRRFRAHAASARALLDGEVVYNRDGIAFDAVDELVQNREPVANAGAGFGASPIDDAGLVLVTIVVALRSSDAFAEVPTDRLGVTRLFAAACNVLPHELVAVEVVWMPAAGDHVMTAFALEARLGRSLAKLDGVVEGTSICAYCGSAYRAEHVRCTHCGGQARAA